MVLILLISMLFPHHGIELLYDQYKSEVDKLVSKTFDLDSLDYKRMDCSFGELKSIEANGTTLGFVLLSEVASCHLGGCSFLDESSLGQSEYFDMLVILDVDRRILKLKILDYFSDYGYEITSKNYLKKFKGKDICDFSKKDDGIDAVSGATISSFALEAHLELLCFEF